jgi:glycosyltransferase involved in cell wall biosynthesis
MKIDWLITELNTLGGAETYVRQMAPRLLHAGCAIRVITFMSGGTLVAELRRSGVTVIELGLKDKFDWKAIVRLSRLWRADKPDLVHTHLYHAGIIGRIVAKVMGIPTVVVHQHGAERARSIIRSGLDRMTSSLVSQYVATCRAVADLLQQREGISGTKIQVIYNGIECLDPISPNLDKPHQELLSSLITIINIGRLSPEKGHNTLLEAVALLHTSHTQTRLVLVGEGESQAFLTERIKELNLNRFVHMLGSRRDIAELLANADIFALPSDWEGVSMALLEAMAAGVPVVATAVGGTPEVVVDGINGLLVPPRDPEALAGALSRLLLDPGLRQHIGQAGRQSVFERFNIQHTVQQTRALYESLIYS